MSASNAPFDPTPERLDLPSPAHGHVFLTREGPRGGAPVLCVHGVPGSVRDFRYLGPRLAEAGFEVIRVDLPGYGQSPRETWRDNTLSGRASLIALIARTLRLERPILAGHSIGGPPCLLAASRYPGRVGGLLLLNSPGLERHRGIQIPELTSGIARRALQVPVLRDQVLRAATAGYRAAGFRDLPDEAQLVQMLEVVDGMDFHQIRGAVRQLRCPVLMASTQDDPLIQARISHGLADAVPSRCVHVHYETGGHYAQKHHARDLASHAQALFA